MIRVFRSLPKDMMVALLCAAFMLAGLAQARSLGEKAEQAGTPHHFALCLQAAEMGEDAPTPSHDCEDCRLTSPPVLALIPCAAPRDAAYAIAELPARMSLRASAFHAHLPWSTGPPNRG